MITPPVAVTVGRFTSSVTVAVAVAVHPLADCTVTVYVPGTLTDGLASMLVNPLGPDQLTIVPVVLALNVTLPLSQVITPPVALTVGASVLAFTVAVAVAVHPLADDTVTVYTPASDTIGEACVLVNPFGPDQLTIVPVVVALS